jgi:hypothetical protein
MARPQNGPFAFSIASCLQILEVPNEQSEYILLYQLTVRHPANLRHPRYGHAKQIGRFPIVEPVRELIQITLQVL